MCRNIRTLFNFDPPATDEEIHAAARQFVRKISGSAKPSRANAPACERATQDIEKIVRALLADLVTGAPPRDRQQVQARARLLNARRFAPKPPS